MTRDEALARLETAPDAREAEERRRYVLMKLGLSDEEYEEIIRLPVRAHADYPTGLLAPPVPVI